MDPPKKKQQSSFQETSGRSWIFSIVRQGTNEQDETQPKNGKRVSP